MALITESESLHHNLEELSTAELLRGINQEDQKVAVAVEQALPALEALVNAILPQMRRGGRLFYIGAGTSGRLGIVDASECPPTFGVDHGVVVGLIAGGDSAIRKAVEFAEDDAEQAWKDLTAHAIKAQDAVVGIAASGTTRRECVWRIASAKRQAIGDGLNTHAEWQRLGAGNFRRWQ